MKIKKSSVHWMFQRIHKRIPLLVLMTAAHIGSAILSVMFALGTRQVIDCAIGADKDAFIEACLVQGAIIAGSILCLTVFRHLKEYLSAELDRDWKRELLHGLLHGDYAGVSSYHSGELINRLNNDVRNVNEGLLNTIPGVASMMTRLIAAMAVLFALEPWFTMIAVFAGMVVIFFTGLMRKRLKGLNKRVSEEEGRVSGFIQETLEKLLMVQAMDVSSEIEKRADVLMNRRFEFQRRRKNVSLAANTGVSLLFYLAGFAALVWCAFGLLNGTMTFGSLTAVTQLVNQLQSPFVNLSGILPKYIAMTASAERLMELYELKAEEEPLTERAEVLYEKMHAIRAEHLEFSYDRNPILKDASFTLEKGSFAVVTGTSGVGKSTILKLLLGIFRPESGRLSIDCNEEQIPLNRASRKLFAYVPQGNLLLSGTLRDNLMIVNPQASEDEVKQALYVSVMDEYLPQLPKGLDTVIGESGAGLSEGQAQRLAIARAVLGGAPILLLDECTSALDARTEQLVLERLRALPGKSCIAVTHRPAAMELCGWNLEIKDGSVNVIKTSEI